MGGLVVLAVIGIGWNQWRLQVAMNALKAEAMQRTGPADESKTQDAQAPYERTRAQLDVAEQKLASAAAQIAQLDQRLRQMESNRPRRVIESFDSTRRMDRLVEPPETAPVKRGWGPEQAAGEPDTLQAGDISTAWAPRLPDGGEEWLKLEYERAVAIAEVRVRETYNPGAIAKVTAVLPNGNEITLWEGVEPKAQPPVEMSFQVTEAVTARSVKVYLDTQRVPGWNEIDAVELIGRDGSHQWAKEASASSTYAAPNVVEGTLRLDRL